MPDASVPPRSVLETQTGRAESATGSCPYCGDAFDPQGNTAKIYCTPVHRKRAAERRRHDRNQPPERTLVCPWCGAEFTTRLASQVFCTADHRLKATACERRRGFLTVHDAEAAAAETPGRVEPHRCPRATGTAHWHLRNGSS